MAQGRNPGESITEKPLGVRAEILAQGQEIVEGQTEDTNSVELARVLVAEGLSVVRHGCVGDDSQAIAELIREACQRSPVVISTGGLGPTEDDLTSDAVSVALGVPLEENPEALAQIRAWYSRRGHSMTPHANRQARIPRGAQVLPNPLGTAPGYRVDHGEGSLWCLPGVPFEMRAMVQASILPFLRQHYHLVPGRSATLRCVGLPESSMSRLMEGFSVPGVQVGYRAVLPEVQLKLRFAAGFDPQACEAVISSVASLLGDALFGIDCGPLEQVVGAALLARGETVATAESCTGGRLAAAFTGIPGSSAWFLDGVVSYSNPAKVRALGVGEDTLRVHGAVSEAVARQMAEGMRQRAGSTWALSTTGIAGPGGGSPDKPVGLVHLALAGPTGCMHRCQTFPGGRLQIMARAVAAALDLLRHQLGPAAAGVGPTGGLGVQMGACSVDPAGWGGAW